MPLPDPSCELPKTDEGGGPAGVKDLAEGGGPAGVVEGFVPKVEKLSSRLPVRFWRLPGVEGGLDEKGTAKPDMVEEVEKVEEKER